ncbi:MAG: VOC family protein [Pseudomonadota bacterium]
MTDDPLFEAAYPFQDDVLSLPVADVEAAVNWYGKTFAMQLVERRNEPCPSAVLERDGVQIGFAQNGGDSSQDGAAIRVHDIHRAKRELEDRGVQVGNWRVDERDGKKFQVFFVVAPDGLCYYFHQAIED